MEYRSFDSELQVRSVSERVMAGILVPFGHDQRIDDYLTERFERAAFRHQYRAAPRIRLCNYHSNTPGHTLIGKGMALRDDAAGLYGEFKVVNDREGDHFLQLAREGMIRQWSIGFRPQKSHRDGQVTVYTRAELFEAALVPEGAYGDLAAVGQVRAALPTLHVDRLRAMLPKPLFPA